jgi:L-amino acid N-acyltransferase YncA
VSSGVAIRPATEADLPAITDIYAHAVRTGTASYEYDPPTLAEMRGRFEALAAARYPYICAEAEDGAVIGYAYAGPFRTRPAYRFNVEDSIYIAPVSQGRGLGKLLLTQLLRESEALGFRQMIAVIGDARVNTASIRLHAALGFAHSGRIEDSGFKFGRWCDTVIMQRPLNGGASTLPAG